MDAKQALDKAIEEAGTAAELAQRIGVTPQALSQWTRVPASRILAVERAVNGKVTRFQLRPDICGESPTTDAA